MHRRFVARHVDDEEDALQEAFCRLWARRSDFSSQGEAEGFLTVAARNLAVDGQRRRLAHPESDLKDIDHEPPDDDSDRSDLFGEIRQLIDRHLSERDREILLHRDHDGWEFDEIAMYYGVSEANARMIVSRARKTIRELYLNRQKI